MKTTVWIYILLLTSAFLQNLHARELPTNATYHWLSFSNTLELPPLPAFPPTNLNQLPPLIEMWDVPITTAIANLARQAGINYIIDPHLFPGTDSNGDIIEEPAVTFCLTNVSAEDALNQMLSLHNFRMISDPVTRIARITYDEEPDRIVNASLLGMETNASPSATNGIIPLIQLDKVPLYFALLNLIRQSGMAIQIDPHITGSGDPPDRRFTPAPTLSVRWQNITAKQAIIAMCKNFELEIVKDDTTGVIRIEPKAVKKRHHYLH